ncbi:MAG TPA: hypothetical protein DEA80_10150 [Afipia sp.]|uniref:hypothetical protein n=1 Tax=unclassified Afipia TaxID=2642050 RepID=UPI0004B49678|nr:MULTISPECIES: hypothetical protein [unclassified Afipia]MAH67955.1 hypothetical protein [Afipia sp.]OUX62808.1 MAG: hypothetical protein CBB64_01780 [Afipia sp. TMED4]HAP14100.1 hypothetical protein [Afipia sp.]HAP46126.1 hypothetical protein [Afipia sp.]HAQ95097.1 hypothetical protein [Afipia sp.]
MKKFGFVVAAVAALAIAVPSIASAQTVVVKTGDRGMHRGHHHGEYRGARAEMHRHHGWHRGHDKKVIVIKRGHHHHHDYR